VSPDSLNNFACLPFKIRLEAGNVFDSSVGFGEDPPHAHKIDTHAINNKIFFMINLIVYCAYSFVDFGHSPFDGAKVLLFADIRKVLFSPFCLYASSVCKKREIFA
jgi:hypothetical protein